MDGLDIGKFADAVNLDPGEERADGPVIGFACVPVANRGGKEFEEAAQRARRRPQ